MYYCYPKKRCAGSNQLNMRLNKNLYFQFGNKTFFSTFGTATELYSFPLAHTLQSILILLSIKHKSTQFLTTGKQFSKTQKKVTPLCLFWLVAGTRTDLHKRPNVQSEVWCKRSCQLKVWSRAHEAHAPEGVIRAGDSQSHASSVWLTRV